MKHLRLPGCEYVKHVAGEFQRQPDGITIVVMGHVMAPVDQRRPVFLRMGEVPVVNIHHPIPAVDLHYGRDQRDHIVAYCANVSAVVHRQTIGELH